MMRPFIFQISGDMAATRIKICGITRQEDARAATDSGADAIGLVFYGSSPRVVSIAQAVAIVPPGLKTKVYGNREINSCEKFGY